jgi:hypothetical protein
MENSFYYFFSATPQVLAAILALFGVFVIFKIQALTIELVDKADTVYKVATTYRNKNESAEEQTLRLTMLVKILHKIKIKNVKAIDEIIEKYVDVIIPNDKDFISAKEGYRQISSDYHNLITETINSSVITAITIVFCLAMLTIGKVIICHTILLYSIFAAVVMSVSYIFYKLYTILKKSFD